MRPLGRSPAATSSAELIWHRGSGYQITAYAHRDNGTEDPRNQLTAQSQEVRRRLDRRGRESGTHRPRPRWPPGPRRRDGTVDIVSARTAAYQSMSITFAAHVGRQSMIRTWSSPTA